MKCVIFPSIQHLTSVKNLKRGKSGATQALFHTYKTTDIIVGDEFD